MTITEFLLARIEEYEAGPGAEREYAPGSLPWTGEVTVSGGHYYHQGEDITDAFTTWLARQHLTDRARRVLAECQAKRAIVTLHDQAGERWTGFPRADRLEHYCMHDQQSAPCPTLGHLATVYADHPDFRQEWKP